jgi:DNA-binding transcriptional ArsR family regulator
VARRSQPTIVDADADSTVCGVVVRAEARELRRSLRPVAWLVLEELMLHVVDVDGVLVAATSARAIAEDLGLDPGTAASALRALRDQGLVRLEQQATVGGRFGLAGYTVRVPAGIELLPTPRVHAAHTVEPCVVQASTAASPSESRRRRRSTRSGNAGQATLDLRLGSR